MVPSPSAHIGEETADAIKHFLQIFATLSIPKERKTENGLAYASHKMQNFFNQWGTTHNTGIPHSPTGQSIVERSHNSLKCLLDKHKGQIETFSTTERLSKVVYVFNFLNNSLMEPSLPIIQHFSITS